MFIHLPFDPLASSVDAWEEFLLKPENHIPDSKEAMDQDYWPPRTELEKVIYLVADACLLEQDQQEIIERAVEASLQNWDVLASFEVNLRTGGTHPFKVLPRIAHTHNGSVPGLVSCTQLLWNRAPITFDPKHPGFIKLFHGFGVRVPLSNIEISNLYLKHFNIYKFIALEVLLRRGETMSARRLFLDRVKEFPDTDPWCMDHLIYHGLLIADAQVWLKQGRNGQHDLVQHSASALQRWQKRYPHRL